MFCTMLNLHFLFILQSKGMPSIYLFNTGWLSVFVQENDMSYLLQCISSCSLSVDVMVERHITD